MQPDSCAGRFSPSLDLRHQYALQMVHLCQEDLWWANVRKTEGAGAQPNATCSAAVAHMVSPVPSCLVATAYATRDPIRRRRPNSARDSSVSDTRAQITQRHITPTLQRGYMRVIPAWSRPNRMSPSQNVRVDLTPDHQSLAGKALRADDGLRRS